ncbi:biotin--[acetyl-CoA-carboxylase] ligase [Guyparkeria halophila]|uniref:Biotin--[acetyl-CoA-carboxylase] ligase n=2 Tax=Guyparkeria halophila TaxID=47960 RepID=A0A6I6CYG1_9GAMM|nr:biotin--[acetyl-CoA-carboxylase] ligase [Guyparkeria halophila]
MRAGGPLLRGVSDWRGGLVLPARASIIGPDSQNLSVPGGQPGCVGPDSIHPPPAFPGPVMHRDVVLDFGSLVPRLQRLAARRGWLLAAEARVDSTNQRVRALLESDDGASRPVVAIAAEQTAGVGRRGARWLSTPGDGLWFSLAVPAETRLPAAPPGLALAGCLAGVLVRHEVPATVKWPNDLYLGEGKLGGLMIERGRLGGELYWLAGVGINWRRPPGAIEAAYPPAALADLGDRWGGDSIALASALVEAAVGLMRRPVDWPAELARLSRAHHAFGQTVVVERADGGREIGTAGAIGSNGNLAVTRADGSVIRAGAHDRVRLLAGRA